MGRRNPGRIVIFVTCRGWLQGPITNAKSDIPVQWADFPFSAVGEQFGLIGCAVLIGGVVITETVFNIPGFGRLVVDAISKRDYPIIQGVILVFSGVYVLINLAVDLSYSLIDPRIRH